MGCASSATAANPGDAPSDKAALAQKQRRKLSVNPAHVGGIDKDNMAGAEMLTDEADGTNLTEDEIAAKGELKHAILSRKGFIPYNKKKDNQDRPVLKYCVGGMKNVSMFGVMDGHGEFGHKISQFVKDKLPEYMAQHLKVTDGKIEDVHKKITDGVLDMCDALKTNKDPVTKASLNCSFSGTTCVFGVLIDDQLHVANIGDSRCVMLQKINGEIKALDLSEDHKPENPIEKQRIYDAGGRVETLPGPPGEDCGPYRVWLQDVDVPGLAMSRSIGDEISQTVGVISVPEISQHTIVPEDMMCVFASDGVWEFMSSQEVCDLMWKHKDDLQNAALQLVEESTKRWKLEEEVIDDITCTIIQFNKFE